MTMQSLRPFILATYELTREANSAAQQSTIGVYQNSVNQAARGIKWSGMKHAVETATEHTLHGERFLQRSDVQYTMSNGRCKSSIEVNINQQPCVCSWHGQLIFDGHLVDVTAIGYHETLKAVSKSGVESKLTSNVQGAVEQLQGLAVVFAIGWVVLDNIVAIFCLPNRVKVSLQEERPASSSKSAHWYDPLSVTDTILCQTLTRSSVRTSMVERHTASSSTRQVSCRKPYDKQGIFHRLHGLQFWRKRRLGEQLQGTAIHF